MRRQLEIAEKDHTLNIETHDRYQKISGLGKTSTDLDICRRENRNHWPFYLRWGKDI